MDWMSWKTWTAVAVIIIAVFAIYTFAAPEPQQQEDLTPVATTAATGKKSVRTAAASGVEPVHKEWLEAQSGSYKSNRNLFAYVEPPPPPPPQPVVPPDKDKDGVPDFRDNCVAKANADQTDLDHNGIGDACQTTPVIVPPPPPPPPPPKPVPPSFDYKYIGMFGPTRTPIATFSGNGEIINARVGDVIAGKFILRSIGIESVEIGFVGFPADERQRIPIGQ